MTPPATPRVDVRKTYKLYIGGAFPRSESGRSYAVTDTKGKFLANAAQASRKDAREAVVAARKAFPAWATATAYNRGQVLYRVAEVMQGRHAQFVDEVRAAEGLTAAQAQDAVDRAIDTWVFYAGWTDKLSQVFGGANPVAGPYFNLTTLEPTGVVAALAPQRSSLLGLAQVVAPIVATGNTTVVLSSDLRPLPAVTLTEALATSDVPGGVINLLTGYQAEVAPWLASHMDVNGIDLTGVSGLTGGTATAAQLARDLEVAAADNLKRVLRPPATEPSWADAPTPARMLSFIEYKTVWHPKGT